MKRWHILLLTLALGLPSGWLRAAPPAGPPNKFLFLVEASAAMSSRAELTALAVADLIERGAGGRMRTGDLFSIVPFNEQPDLTGYTGKVWDASRSRHISNLAFLHLQKFKFEKRARPDRVMALLQLVTMTEPGMVIYLVTSGEDPLAGTPFDAEINAVCQRHLPQWRTTKGIAVTALVAERGQIVDWAVGVAEPPAPVRLLARHTPVAPPKPPVTNQVESVVAKTNPPPVIKPTTNQVASTRTTTSPANQPPVVKPPPVKTTNQTTAAVLPPLKTNPPPIIPPKPTNPVVIVKPPEIKPEPPKPVATNPVVKVVAPTPAATNPAVVAAGPSNPPPPMQPLDLTPSNLLALPRLVSVAESNTARSPTNPTTVEPLATGGPTAGRPYGMLLAGLGCLVVAVWLSVAWYRRTRPATGPSLITQSMDRSRRQPPKE